MKMPDGKHIDNPPRKAKMQLPRYTMDLFQPDLNFGNSSKNPATVGSHIPRNSLKIEFFTDSSMFMFSTNYSLHAGITEF